MTFPRKLCYLCIIILATLTVALVFISYDARYRGLLRVSVLNVGQGDAIFIETPSGSQFVIDGGPQDNLSKELGGVMRFYDRTVDGVMVTNPDTDHYSGFLSMLYGYKVDLFIEAGTKTNTPLYKELKDKMREQGADIVTAKRGQRIVLDSAHDVYLEILFPDRDVSNLSSNDGSIVARLVYGETSMMLQGDSPAKIEEYLITLYGQRLRSNILKLGHHGSRTSTMKEYVEAVSPKYAVVSLGEGNRYGHPHQEVLETLESLNVPLLRTDIEGRITLMSDGKVFVHK